MKRKTLGLLALVVTLMWVLAAAVPVEAKRYSRYHGHKHYGHRSSVVTSFHAPYYAPYYGSYYYRPYHHRPYYYRPYHYGYPYVRAPVAYGWPFFWPGASFYFSF
jgi:hypothetical protein